MAAVNLNPVRAIGKEYTPIPFSFAPNGAGAVVQSSIQGEGITSVTRTGVGVFDIVLRSPWYSIIDFLPSIQLAADADTTISSWNYVAATRTLTIRTRTGAAAADIAANASNRLGGTLWARNSSVGK